MENILNEIPLVLLHGFCENKSIWKEQLEHFKNRNIIALDLPGHGDMQAVHAVCTMDMMAKSVVNYLRQKGINKAFVAGHSMGGYVALAIADLYPDLCAGMALINSCPWADDEQKKKDRMLSAELARRNKDAFIEGFIPKLFPEDFAKSHPLIGAWIQQMAQQTSTESIQACLMGMAERPDRAHVLENFEHKLLFIAGAQDQIISKDRIAAYFGTPKRATGVILENCGHMAHLEKAHEVNNALEDWWKQGFSH